MEASQFWEPGLLPFIALSFSALNMASLGGQEGAPAPDISSVFKPAGRGKAKRAPLAFKATASWKIHTAFPLTPTGQNLVIKQGKLKNVILAWLKPCVQLKLPL